jgi:hypothetical protein
MFDRLTRYWVAKFTNKLLASVDLYKLINEIHEIHETLDTKIHNTQINLDNLQVRLDNLQVRLDNLPQDIFKLYYNQENLNPQKIELSKEIISVFDLYAPLKKEFIRKGDDKDGGYVVINDLSNKDTLFSIGVGNNISFDLDCENQVSKIVLIDDSVPDFRAPNDNYSLHRKKLGIIDDNLSITLDKLLNTYPSADYILKIDIEGDEWKILSSLPTKTLNKFRQIIIEFHSIFDLAELGSKQKTLSQLLATHFPVVAHPNNIGGYQIIGNQLFPNVLETTWLRRNSYEFMKGIDSRVLDLQKPNDPEKSDIWISWIYR